MDNTQEERIKFEKWARTGKHPEGGYKLATIASGEYIDPETRCAWRGWNARATGQDIGNRPQRPADLREYDTVAHLVSALSSMCVAEPNKVVDLLTGYLWDEEEAGHIKASHGLQAPRISL